MDDESNSYFRQIVRDAISDLAKNTRSYCFSLEQYNAINKEIPCDVERVYEGIYYLVKKEGANYVKKGKIGRPRKRVRGKV